MPNVKLDHTKENFEEACDVAGGEFGESPEGENYFYCELGENRIKSNGARAAWIGEQLEPIYAQISPKEVRGYADEEKGTREFGVENPDMLDYSQISLTTGY